jgi:hypothetical protein
VKSPECAFPRRCAPSSHAGRGRGRTGSR